MTSLIAVVALSCLATAWSSRIPAYVINLKHRTARLDRFQARFRGMEDVIDLHVIEATNTTQALALVEKGEIRVKEGYRDPIHGRVIKAGEIGCAHSHFRAWAAIAQDEDHDWGIVFEDDAVFSDDFKQRFKVWRALEPNLDVVFYAHKKVDLAARAVPLGKGIESFVYSYWAIAYAITRDAAKVLTNERFLQNLVPSDEYLPSMLLAAECDRSGVCDETTLRGASYSHDLASPDNFGDAFSDTELSEAHASADEAPFTLFTIATDTQHAGFQVLERSARYFGVPLVVLNAEEEWKGGNMLIGQGGGQKLTAMKRALARREDPDQVIMFVDGYDTMLIKSADDIATLISERLEEGRVLFAVERFCWPDADLADHYPEAPEDSPYRFLNSGTYLGRAKDIAKLLEDWDEADLTADDQLFLTYKFLSDDSMIDLDYDRALFQTLSGIEEDEWEMADDTEFVRTDGEPSAAVLHGNGASKTILEQISNYEAGAWTPFYGTMWHPRRHIDDTNAQVLARYDVALAVVCMDTPFPEQFEAGLMKLDVDFERTRLMIWRDPGCKHEFGELVNRPWHIKPQVVTVSDEVSRGKQAMIAAAREAGSDAIFFVDSSVFIELPETLADLLRDNLSIIAPHAQHPGESLFSNYWTGVSSEGWFEEAWNTHALFEQEHRGLWRVPFVMGTYLIHREHFERMEDVFEQCTFVDIDIDVCVAQKLRNMGVGMFADNTKTFAELLEEPERAYHGDCKTPDLFEAVQNPYAWDRAYLDPQFLAGNHSAAEVCPDVFGVQIFNPRFARELVAEMDRADKWSNGGNKDERIGGYENVPTVDTHLNQIGFHEAWVSILQRHLYPIMYERFQGTTLEEEPNISFVVKYQLAGQRELTAHQDASMITTVTTLSSDFEGGGAHFTRYNCTFVSKTLGLTVFHPGKVTHEHRGRMITQGKRYILVSFND